MIESSINTNPKKRYQDAFEYLGSIFTQYYYYGIFKWQILYKGGELEWSIVKDPTIANPQNTRKMFSLNTAKIIASELANLVWAEGCKICVSSKGIDPNSNSKDILAKYIDDVIKDNDLICKLRKFIESGCALGGFAVRAYADGKKNDKGEIVGDSRIKLSYFTAPNIIPISWDNKRIKECVFLDKKLIDGWYYTKMEIHEIQQVLETNEQGEKVLKDEYVVANKYFKSNDQNILGIEEPLCDVWGQTYTETRFTDLDSIFAYIPTSIGNNLDPNSPLGLSIFANCFDTIKALDIAFDSFVREIKLGRKRIIVPTSAIKAVGGADGIQRYFDSNDAVYEAMYFDNPEQMKIIDNTVQMRITEHVEAINGLLNILASQIGLSVGTFSFDKTQGVRTATEVISENSKTFRFVRLSQEPIKKAIGEIIKSIIDLAIAYEVEFEYNGKKYKIADLAQNGYDVSIIFDDSIIQDKSSQLTNGLLLVQNDLMSKETFMTEILGWTEEKAKAEIEKLNNQAPPATPNVFDFAEGE